MSLKNIKIGFAITGSHCTFDEILPIIKELREDGAEINVILSAAAANTDTRFGTAQEWREKFALASGKPLISTITEAEPIGPENQMDCIVVAPCTGNTLGKLANGITDGAVTMAVKAHLRNLKPVIISISTNDGLGNNAKNLGMLLNAKNIFFVPFSQDNPEKKPNSLVANVKLIKKTVSAALEGKQIQPLLDK